MIIEQVRIGKTTITIDKDWFDGLYTVSKGRRVFWVADNEESAREYFKKLIGE